MLNNFPKVTRGWMVNSWDLNPGSQELESVLLAHQTTSQEHSLLPTDDERPERPPTAVLQADFFPIPHTYTFALYIAVHQLQPKLSQLFPQNDWDGFRWYTDFLKNLNSSILTLVCIKKSVVSR